MVNRIWTTMNSVFWLATWSQIKKKFTMLPNDSSLFFTFWWKKNCSISLFFMLYRKLSINGIATTISIVVFCLRNLIWLICLLVIFADQVFIDPTFFGIFVCGPLQSFVVTALFTNDITWCCHLLSLKPQINYRKAQIINPNHAVRIPWFAVAVRIRKTNLKSIVQIKESI